MSEITLVLVGKTGHGKSSTGNTILQKISFEEADRMTDGTELLELKRARLSGDTLLKVYDTPGLMSMTMTESKIIKELDHLIDEAKKIDIFCFVFKYNTQFTREERKTVEELKKQFGEQFLRNNGIVIVTHGDNCTAKARQEGIRTQEMFKKWYTSAGEAFGKLISEVHGKVLLVNNKGDFSEKSQRMQSSCELRQMIQEVAMKKRPVTKRVRRD